MFLIYEKQGVRLTENIKKTEAKASVLNRVKGILN